MRWEHRNGPTSDHFLVRLLGVQVQVGVLTSHHERRARVCQSSHYFPTHSSAFALSTPKLAAFRTSTISKREYFFRLLLCSTSYPFCAHTGLLWCTHQNTSLPATAVLCGPTSGDIEIRTVGSYCDRDWGPIPVCSSPRLSFVRAYTQRRTESGFSHKPLPRR